MPTISMFYGIVIQMFFDDHNPPHFHAYYQDYEASFTLDGDVLKGSFPLRQKKLVVAWAEIHQEELLANWNLAKSNMELYRIDPLK